MDGVWVSWTRVADGVEGGDVGYVKVVDPHVVCQYVAQLPELWEFFWLDGTRYNVLVHEIPVENQNVKWRT